MIIENREIKELNGYTQDTFDVEGVSFAFDYSGNIIYSKKRFLKAYARENNSFSMDMKSFIEEGTEEVEVEEFKMDFVNKTLKIFNEHIANIG